MITLRDATREDMPWVISFLENLGAPNVICNTQHYDLRKCSAIIAERSESCIGATAYRLEEDAMHPRVMRCEQRRTGAGQMLVQAIIDKGCAMRMSRVHLTTTTDNLPAQALHGSVGCTLIRREFEGFADILRLMGRDPSEKNDRLQQATDH